jgi:hypothetical protein
VVGVEITFSFGMKVERTAKEALIKNPTVKEKVNICQCFASTL